MTVVSRRTDARRRTRQAQAMARGTGARRGAGRAAAWRKHRCRGACHGEFRPIPAAAGQAAAALAERQRPDDKARMMAAGADRILDEAVLFDDLPAALADCSFVLATTARAHDQAKRVIDAAAAAHEIAPRVEAGETVAIMFGRERNGLKNDEVALADRIVTLPVNPAFASLNLAQAVVIVAYEWFKLASGETLPFAMPEKSPPAPKEQLLAFFASLERELEQVEFFRPPDKRETMQINLRNIFTRMQPSQQDIQTLHGVIMAIAQGRKGPARGGVLDGEEAAMLRALLAEHGGGRVPNERGPVRGPPRLLRRHPTDAHPARRGPR